MNQIRLDRSFQTDARAKPARVAVAEAAGVPRERVGRAQRDADLGKLADVVRRSTS